MYIDLLSHRPSRWRRALRYLWSKRLRRGWSVVWPFLAAGLALVVVVLGYVGYRDVHPEEGWSNSLYRAMQLFVLESNPVDHKNTWLEIARLLGPVVVGYAAVRAIVGLYHDRLTRFWRRHFMRNHVVVAGLGVAGSRLAAAFEDDGWRVVAIEIDPASATIHTAIEDGIGVIAGDASETEILRNAGVERANLLVVTCGHDARNIDVVTAARNMLGRQRGVLTALVELDDFTLWQAMKAQAFVDRDEHPLRLEFFNIYSLGAERLVDRHDPLSVDGELHVLVVGMEGAGPSLVLELIRRRAGKGHLTITIAGPLADADRARLLRRESWIERRPEVEIRTWSVEPDGAARLEGVPDGVTAAFICLDNETEALTAALALRRQPELSDPEIVMVLADDEAGVGLTVRRGLPALSGVHAFGTLRRSLTPEVLEHTITERIARRSHELHRAQQLERGESEQAVEGIRPWNELRHLYRESNRLYADGIPSALARLDCVIEHAPPEPSAEPFALTPEEVELIAPLEHERWERAQRRLGFRPGRKRRTLPFYKSHPMIGVPWDELPEANKEKDRAHVRMIPEVLAHVGLAVRRSERLGGVDRLSAGSG